MPPFTNPIPTSQLPLIGQGLGQATSLFGNIGQMVYGYYQARQGNKSLKQLEGNRPVRFTDPNFLYNQDLARHYSSQGFTGEQRNAFSEEAGQNLSEGISASLRSGQGGNLISRLIGQNNNQYLKYLAMDAEQQQRNLANLYSANSAVAKENQANWQYNVADPYAMKYARATQMANAGVKNMFGAIRNQANAFASFGADGSGGKERNDDGGGGGGGYNAIQTGLESNYGVQSYYSPDWYSTQIKDQWTE